jgi:hypothetical protein
MPTNSTQYPLAILYISSGSIILTFILGKYLFPLLVLLHKEDMSLKVYLVLLLS